MPSLGPQRAPNRPLRQPTAMGSRPLNLWRSEQMKIEITYSPEDNTYHWKLWDGPADLSDEYSGIELSLGQCFEDIMKCRIINSIKYVM